MSNAIQATITVCGQETIKPLDDERKKIELKQSEKAKYYIIGSDTYSKWFKLEGGSENCGISKAVLKGYESSDSPAFINEQTQELKINIERDDKNSVYELEVTTRGGQKASKLIFVEIKPSTDTSFNPPC